MTRCSDVPMSVIASDLRYPEGPVALDDGSLLVVEVANGTLVRLTPTVSERPIVARCGGGPNGAAVGPDGRVYVCNNGGYSFRLDGELWTPVGPTEDNVGGSIQVVDLGSGAVEVCFTACDGEPIGMVNDLVFDRAGGCWITDTSRGMLYYADVLGGAIRMVDEGLDLPNGVGLSPGGDRLYAAETVSGRIHEWDVLGPGQVGSRRLLFSSGGEHGWDSLAVDGEGNVCVATLRASGISVVSPNGTLVARIGLPLEDPMVSNICFGGSDLRDAYITSAGRGVVYHARWPQPGLALAFRR